MRNRSSIPGGYIRKTITVPPELLTRISRLMDRKPGLTMSAFFCDAAEAAASREEKRKK